MSVLYRQQRGRLFHELRPSAVEQGVAADGAGAPLLNAKPFGGLDDLCFMKNFATFSQRFIAMWIDFLVFVPFMLAYQGVESISKVAAVIFTIFHVCLGQAYSIYGHGRFGKTVGKWVMGIRVVRVTGEPLRWREAWLRSAFDLCFVFVSTIGQIAAMIAIANSEYYGVGWSTRSANLAAHEPTWATLAMKFGTIWVFSEVVTMLFNKRRRALHDFVAGTVVVSERRQGAAEQAVAADDPAAGTLV
jgi:uncharacterized RDD family membrane protein YckC